MAKYGFGVDIGGTTVKLGLFDVTGSLLDQWQIDTDLDSNGAHIPSDIAASILEKLKTRAIPVSDCIGVGVGIPGPIHRDGTASAVNLGWDHLPALATIEGLTGLPAVGDNDANMAALGEYWAGSGRGYASLVLVTLGTGVGGGIIIDGRSLKGAHGAGGEIGHIPIDPSETERCSCGSHGCLEQYASATGNVRIARKILAATDEPSVLRSVDKLDARACWDAAASGDRLAQKISEIFSDYLARGLAAVANTVDPEIILLGGGVSRAGEPLLKLVRASYLKYAFPACRATPIELASLSNSAGIHGAFHSILTHATSRN